MPFTFRIADFSGGQWVKVFFIRRISFWEFSDSVTQIELIKIVYSAALRRGEQFADQGGELGVAKGTR